MLFNNNLYTDNKRRRNTNLNDLHIQGEYNRSIEERKELCKQINHHKINKLSYPKPEPEVAVSLDQVVNTGTKRIIFQLENVKLSK